LIGLTVLAFISCRNSGPSGILEINVDPQSASLARGQTLIFTAEAVAANIPPEHSVTWSIDQSNRDPETTISSDGRLRVANSEHLSAITVRATSTHDPSISGTATITINAAGGGGSGGGSGGGGNHGSGGNPAPIGVAGFTVIAPVTGATPSDTAFIATGAGFTVSPAEWYPAHNLFRPNTSYIVTITLTANANHIFHSSGVHEFAGTININNANVTITNNGQTATLSFTFTPSVILNLAEQLLWLRNHAESGGTYTAYAIDPHEYLSPTAAELPSGINSLTISSLGNVPREVRLSGNGVLFEVPAGVTLTLGENLTLVGHSANNSPLVQVNSDGTLIMNAGSMIASNTNTSGPETAGGVLVTGTGASFTMTGGQIQNNTTGGGNSGGGVNIANGATFTMTNGIINNNTAGTGSSGGVNLGNDGTFSMRGGQITGNEVNTGGGGVRVGGNPALFEMRGGVITGNVATTTSGANNSSGVSVLANGTFRISDGHISGNTITAPSSYAALRNIPGSSVQRGTFDSSDVFTPILTPPTLTNTHNPINVANGVLLP